MYVSRRSSAIRNRLPGYSISLERKKQYLQSRLQMAPVGLARRWKACGVPEGRVRGIATASARDILGISITSTTKRRTTVGPFYAIQGRMLKQEWRPAGILRRRWVGWPKESAEGRRLEGLRELRVRPGLLRHAPFDRGLPERAVQRLTQTSTSSRSVLGSGPWSSCSPGWRRGASLRFPPSRGG